MKLIPSFSQPSTLSRRRVTRAAVSWVLVTALFIALPSLVAAAGSVVYTAFGDSIAFGAFAPIGRGYVPLYAKALADDTRVSVTRRNLGVPGWTSQDLLTALGSKPLFRLAAFSSDVITWNIGGNDLSAARNLYKAGTCGDGDNEQCLRAAVASLENNWDGILNAISRLRRSRPTIIRTMDIYNPFVNIDKASDSWPPGGGGDGRTDFDVFKFYLDAVNTYIAAASVTKGVLVAPVYYWFNGADGGEDPGAKGLLAFDDFHPNAQGHALIASLLRGLGYSTVTP
jgi:lysophospholipase L1-like esterase